jgi:N-acetylglucosaminyldiphosphoundecaprenol N-acetyl-beta-D-mannosaminyltransferase
MMKPDPTVSLPGLGVQVLDGDSDALILALGRRLREEPRGRSITVVAVHVNALLHKQDDAYLHALQKADLVYADGNSVVLLARIAGARHIHRSVTTDVGWDMLESLKKFLGRKPRLALIGGTPGLSALAGIRMADRAHADLVFTSHGFHDEWATVIDELCSSGADVLMVGLGSPREVKWIMEHRDRLPPLVITCGGWFGYIAGKEQRAPLIWQRLGLEWVYRLIQDPRRLASRYARGMAVVTIVSAGAFRERIRSLFT